MITDIEKLAEIRQLAATGVARDIRLDARVTLTEVALACGVSEACVSRWETGKRVPRSASALRYRAVLKLLDKGHSNVA